MFSWAFEKKFKKLADRQLDIPYLSSAFLSIGMTVVIFSYVRKFR